MVSSFTDMPDTASWTDGEYVFDPAKVSTARLFDYWLGGKDHWPVDRGIAERLQACYPEIWTAVRQNRSFVGRAVRHLAADHGIRQFIDIGVGMPGIRNVHDVALSVDRESRVVYVDNDRLVVRHAQAMMAHGHPTVEAVEADLRSPQGILDTSGVRRQIDLSTPVGVMATGVLDFISDSDDPQKHVAVLMEALPAGSVLALSHGVAWPCVRDGADAFGAMAGLPVCPRRRSEIARFFDGLELLSPGLVSVDRWRRVRTGRRCPWLMGGMGMKQR